MKKPKLKFGETPFDGLTREQALHELKRAYIALSSAKSCLRVMQIECESQPFWSPAGTGGEALEKCESVLRSLSMKRDADEIYRSYFRYASPLLFPGAYHSRWVVCEACGMMVSALMEKQTEAYIGQPCYAVFPLKKTCQGRFRWLTLDDLKPEK